MKIDSSYKSATAAEKDQVIADLVSTVENATADLETMRRVISHDLRTPLAGVIGFVNVIRDTCSNEIDPKTLGFIERIHCEARRMEYMISRLTDLMHLSNRKMKVEKVDLSVLARILAAELMLENLDRPVTFSISDGLVVAGDAKMMRTLMENLLGNAWKFSRENENALIHVGSEQIQGREVFFVRDNGIGFDMSRMARLFQPFRKLHDDPTIPGEGAGLAAAKRIIQRHNGSIWAESAPDKGATFFFTIQS